MVRDEQEDGHRLGSTAQRARHRPHRFSRSLQHDLAFKTRLVNSVSRLGQGNDGNEEVGHERADIDLASAAAWHGTERSSSRQGSPGIQTSCKGVSCKTLHYAR